ncbi:MULTISPECIES: hypothetical protein [unclassified Pseudoalteromonas]|nr:hypothetical protein [Pseudoalteromonas sp. XMcav2-N]MCO7191333.1 hypothetical protein [Pseudoalteromonas sp. XMcav2-N]
MKFKVNKKELKNLQDKNTLNAQQTRKIGGAGHYNAPGPRTNTTFPSLDG